MYARVNTLQAAPNRIDDVARVVREIVLPGIRGEAGFRGYLVLGSRDTGKALGVTLWQTEDERQASDARAHEIRPHVEAATGGTMEAVERYDVLLFDLAP